MLYRLTFSVDNLNNNEYIYYYSLESIKIKFTCSKKAIAGSLVRILSINEGIISLELAKEQEATQEVENLVLVTTLFPLDAKENYIFYSKNSDCRLVDIFRSEDQFGNCKYLLLVSSILNYEICFDFICTTYPKSSIKFFLKVDDEK